MIVRIFTELLEKTILHNNKRRQKTKAFVNLHFRTIVNSEIHSSSDIKQSVNESLNMVTIFLAYNDRPFLKRNGRMHVHFT